MRIVSNLAVWLSILVLSWSVDTWQAHSQEIPDLRKRNFERPPDSARPWVYWFWLNGNISSNGITADLEAMKRAGIGGVLIMEVDQGAPLGPVDFMSSRWRQLFTHVVSEAQRLGLEVNMNNDAGWNGSGGPWIKPEQSMQKIVWTETPISGGQRFQDSLSPPQSVAGYYRDIVVLAFPTPAAFRIDNLKVKAGYEVATVGATVLTNLPSTMVISHDSIVDLTPKTDSNGRLDWDAPPGQWTVLRVGHTCTGVENAPSPASGRGLECDKLSKAGIEANFNGMMDKLIADVGPLAGRSLAATHIDSWENGAQNWTARMREEFQQRRGYDLQRFLPVVTGRVVDSLEVSERFLWDLRKTISELVVENYAGHLQTLAHQHGMRLSIEAYGGPCEDLPYAGRADEPMCEFWIGGSAFNTIKGMASAAHTYGKPILGAEAFTAADQEKWLEHPGSIKALGDRAFCDGVNRFVFHRFALQPWAEERQPGMTMGPWGLHYERTQTWWNFSRPWHEYLARCQFLLREGLFVADLCYLQPEAAPQDYRAHNLEGYDYDECSAEAVLTRMSVKEGRCILPDGMSYRALVLSDTPAMTPALLRKIKQLVEAGATVVGARPVKSPSLEQYPRSDEEVRSLAAELWGPADGQPVQDRPFGRGRLIAGIKPEKVLADAGLKADFTSRPHLGFIHRRAGDSDIYFVANPMAYAVETVATFRVTGKRPELWWPESGRTEAAAVWQQDQGATAVPLRLEASGSVFVVFQSAAHGLDPIVAVRRDGQLLTPPADLVRPIIGLKAATYGVPGDPKRTRDVRARLQRLVDAGEFSFQVARMAEGDDPALLVIKTLSIDYTLNGKPVSLQGTDPETLSFVQPMVMVVPRHIELHASPQGRESLVAWEPGRFELQRASGSNRIIEVPVLPTPVQVEGPWEVQFDPHMGAPEKTTFAQLIDWSRHQETGIKYYSGAATYRTVVSLSPEMLSRSKQLFLDLGKVSVMAQVRLNGHDLGTLWKEPFMVDMTGHAQTGANRLEIRVVNLWVNRLIGDEQLPDDSERNPDGTLKAWPAWLQAGQPSSTGRHTFTTWRLWKKDSSLQESGLIGPVLVRTAFFHEVD